MESPYMNTSFPVDHYDLGLSEPKYDYSSAEQPSTPMSFTNMRTSQPTYTASVYDSPTSNCEPTFPSVSQSHLRPSTDGTMQYNTYRNPFGAPTPPPDQATPYVSPQLSQAQPAYAYSVPPAHHLDVPTSNAQFQIPLRSMSDQLQLSPADPADWQTQVLLHSPSIGPMPAERTSTTSNRRRQQNRDAQRKFRERKENHTKELAERVKALEQENEKLRGSLKKKSAENDMLRQALEVFKSGDDEDLSDSQTGGRRSSNATLRQLLDIMTKNNEVRGSSMKEENEERTS